jgi:GPH family glycoside/pentoside/hexuronide:cation symporter
MAVKTQTGHLPRRVKFFYGAGDTGFSLLYTMLDFFFLKYLLDVVQLSPALAAGAIFVGRSWDWINDPLVGFLSDRIYTRWGRRRPFILFGAVPFALSFLLLWWIPPIADQVGLAVYYGLAYFVFDALATLVSVPYYALTPEMTPDYDERTSLNAYRMSFSIVAGLIAYAPLLVLDRFPSAQVGFMVMAAIFGVISAGPLFGVCAVARERPGYRSDMGGSGMGDLVAMVIRAVRQRWPLVAGGVAFVVVWIGLWLGWAGLNEARQGAMFAVLFVPLAAAIIRAFRYNPPFLYAMGIFLLTWTTVAVLQAILPFFVQYWLLLSEDDLFLIMLSLFLSALAFLPLWNWFAHRFGKRGAYITGMSFWALVQIVLIFVQPGSALWVVLGLAILAGVGVSTAHIIPVSIIPDTLEWDELHTGQRREGMYYSLVSLLNKVGSSIAVPAASLLLGWSGYVPNQPQSTRTLWAIRSLVGPIPAMLLTAGILLAAFYPLSRERHAYLREELAQRRAMT